jgi:hypothetical protein
LRQTETGEPDNDRDKGQEIAAHGISPQSCEGGRGNLPPPGKPDA